MAVNVLTVGATDANGEVWASSSYISDDENIPKPEVVAPGVNIVVPNLGTNSGTSFATSVGNRNCSQAYASVSRFAENQSRSFKRDNYVRLQSVKQCKWKI